MSLQMPIIPQNQAFNRTSIIGCDIGNIDFTNSYQNRFSNPIITQASPIMNYSSNNINGSYYNSNPIITQAPLMNNNIPVISQGQPIVNNLSGNFQNKLNSNNIILSPISTTQTNYSSLSSESTNINNNSQVISQQQQQAKLKQQKDNQRFNIIVRIRPQVEHDTVELTTDDELRHCIFKQGQNKILLNNEKNR